MWGLSGFRRWKRLRTQEQLLQSYAVGINSTVDVRNDLHIVLLDYDVTDVERVICSVRELQEFWNLADAQLFKTRNGYHAIFWYDQVPYERLKMIVDYARDVDPMFKYLSRFYQHKTLRVAGKYKELDVQFERTLTGKRKPSALELQRGALKMREHQVLRS